MSDREQYTPGPAHGAQLKKDGEKWVILVMRHLPGKVWRALTDPAHLLEWVPFTVDNSLGTVRTAHLGGNTHADRPAQAAQES